MDLRSTASRAWLRIRQSTTIVIRHLCGRARAGFFTVRRWEATTVYQRIVYFSGIVAFVSATQYFSAKPSLKVELAKASPPAIPEVLLIDYSLMREFYDQAGIDVPELLASHEELGSLFHRRPRVTHDGEPPWSQLRTAVRVPPGADTAEYERLLNMDFYPNIFGPSGLRPGLPWDVFKKHLLSLKTQLDPTDYRNLLAGALYSRVFWNRLYIKNDGDFDLRSIMLVVPSPDAKMTGGRDDNILRVQCATHHVCEITEYKNRVEIRMPELKRHHGMTFQFLTRENAISQDEIVCSFDTIKMGGNAGFLYLAVAGTMLLIYLVCRGSKLQ